MIRAAQRTGAAAALVGAVLLWLPAPAGADDTQVGWWYRYTGQSAGTASAPETAAAGESAPSGDVDAAQAPTTLPPTPVPPPTVPIGDPPAGVPAPVPPLASVPDGGLYVANDPAGPSAVSALRIASGPVGEATLTLTFAEGPSVASGAVAILACPILAGFQPVTNGAWVDRPAHDCQRIAVTGVLDSAGTTLTWTLPSGFQAPGSDFLEVILIPVTGDGTTYSVAFEGPGADALRTLGPPPPPPTAPPTTVFQPDPAAPAAEYNSSSGGVGGIPRPGPGAVNRPDPAATTAPAPPGPTDEATDTPRLPASPIAGVLDDRPWARWMSTSILVAIAAALLLASRRGPVTSAGVSAGAGPQRGIGRFASPRTGHPPAVS